MPSSRKLMELPRPWIEKNYALRVVWYEWLLGLECRRIRANVLLNASNFGRGGNVAPHITYIQQSLSFSAEALQTLPMAGQLALSVQRFEMSRSCRDAVKVICQNTVMTNCVTEAFHLDPAKVVTIYSEPKELGSSANPALFNKSNIQPGKNNRLLYVGSDWSYKRLETAVDGMEIIRRSVGTAELIMTLKPDHPYNLREGVKCIGYLDDEQLSAAYRSADILVLPSLVESGPRPPLEAMSLGIPVLIADRPYAHDVCGDTALFFDPNSPADFAEKAIQLFTNHGLRQTLVAKGLKLVDKRRAKQPYRKIVDIVVRCAHLKAR